MKRERKIKKNKVRKSGWINKLTKRKKQGKKEWGREEWGMGKRERK